MDDVDKLVGYWLVQKDILTIHQNAFDVARTDIRAEVLGSDTIRSARRRYKCLEKKRNECLLELEIASYSLKENYGVSTWRFPSRLPTEDIKLIEELSLNFLKRFENNG